MDEQINEQLNEQNSEQANEQLNEQKIEQNDYQKYYQHNISKKQPQKPRRKFLYFWGPFLLKLLIVYVVSCIFIAVLMGQYFESTIGLDTVAIAEYMAVEENYYDVLNEVMSMAAPHTTIMEGLAALITIPIMLFMFYRDRAREKMKGTVEAKKAPLWTYIAIVLMAVALCMGINNLLFISNLASLSAGYEQTMEALYAPSLGVQIVCLGILIPVCEELVFRGLMYKRLREYSGFTGAMLYTAFVFSFMHINIVQAVYAFFMAVVFAFVYEKYGSVKAPVIAHVAANTTAVFATHYNAFEWIMADKMRSGVLTVACAAIAASMYVFIQRMEDEI